MSVKNVFGYRYKICSNSYLILLEILFFSSWAFQTHKRLALLCSEIRCLCEVLGRWYVIMLLVRKCSEEMGESIKVFTSSGARSSVFYFCPFYRYFRSQNILKMCLIFLCFLWLFSTKV